MILLSRKDKRGVRLETSEAAAVFSHGSLAELEVAVCVKTMKTIKKSQ
jgi:hypothetical protein